MAQYPKISHRFSKGAGRPGIWSRIKMFLITVGAVFIVISFFWGEFGFVRMWFLAKKIDRLKSDIRVLKVERNDILWETDKMKNDPVYFQQYAVEVYGYARPDQQIIQFVPGDSTTTKQAGSVRNLQAHSRK